MRPLVLSLILLFTIPAFATDFECTPDAPTARRNKETRAVVTLSADRLSLTFVSYGANGRVVIPLAEFERSEYAANNRFMATHDALTAEGDSFAYPDSNMMHGHDGVLNIDVEAVDLAKMVLIYGTYNCTAK